MSFSVTKFFSGFAFWKGEVLGKILFVALIAAIALGIYHKLIQSSQTIVARKGSVINVKQETGKEHVFTEIYGYVETDGEYGGGVRCGWRF